MVFEKLTEFLGLAWWLGGLVDLMGGVDRVDWVDWVDWVGCIDLVC